MTAISATLGAVLLHRLWLANLKFPLFPASDDALLTRAAIFKGLLHNPWFYDNSALGAPFGFQLRDSPHVDVIAALWVKVASLATKNDILIANLYLLASYPLGALISHFVLRRLNVRSCIAVSASLLFTFLSFHPIQLVTQPLLGVGYVTVPLVVSLALSLLSGQRLLFDAEGTGGLRFVNGRETWLSVGTCILVGITGNLWLPVISAYLMLVAGLLAIARDGSRIILARCIGVAAGISLSWGASAFPALLYAYSHGRPTSLASMHPVGLRLGQFVFPDAVRSLARLPKGPADAQFLYFAERGTAYLGILITLGCGFLAYSLLRGGKQPKHIRALAVLSAASLLLGITGALPAVARRLPMPSVDPSSLVSVYVAFTALVALALLITRWIERRVKTSRMRLAGNAAIACATLFGLWDQQVVLNVDYDQLRTRSGEWSHAINAIERAFPGKQSLFQLPNVLLPEREPATQLEASEQLLPYLYSSSLRFSYGSFADRKTGEFMRVLAALPIDQIVDRLVLSGFSGVFVATKGYPSHGEQVRSALNVQLGNPILLMHRQIAVYSLLSRKAKLMSDLGEKEFQRRRAEFTSQPYWGWLEGCYPSEPGASTRRVWCESSSRFVIDNPTSTPVHVVVEAKLQVAPVNTRVLFHGDLFSRELVIEHSARDFSEGFDVPPGEHFVSVSVDGIRVEERNGRGISVVFDDPHFATIVR